MNLKRLSIMMIVVLSALLSGCSANKADSNNSSGNNLTAEVKSQGQIGSRIFPSDIDVPLSPSRDTVIYSQTTLLGRGFNSVTGEKDKAKCVEYKGEPGELETASSSTAPEVIYRMRRVSNFESLRESLSIAAAASFGFGIFSGDASFSYLTSGSHSRYSEYLLVEVTVSKPAEQLKNVVLTENGLNAINGGIGKFIFECGDEFVYARRNGGVLRAIISFSASSDEEQQQIGSKLSASMPLFGSGEAEFQSAVQEIKKSTNVSVLVFRKGTKEPVPVTMDELLQQSKDFPTLVDANPSFFQYQTLGYGAVTGSSQYENLMNLGMAIKKQNDAFITLADYVNKSFQIKSDLRYYQANKSQFNWETDEPFEKIWDTNEKTIREITSEADLCRLEPEVNCNTPKPYEFVSYKITRKSGSLPPPTPITTTPAPKPCQDNWVSEEGGQLLNEYFYTDRNLRVTDITSELKSCRPNLQVYGAEGITGMFRLTQPEGKRIYSATMPSGHPRTTNFPYSCIYQPIEDGRANRFTITTGSDTKKGDALSPITFVLYYEKLKKCN